MDTYGSLAKWVALGATEAIEAHLQFDTECRTFLVRHHNVTQSISIYHYVTQYWKEL